MIDILATTGISAAIELVGEFQKKLEIDFKQPLKPSDKPSPTNDRWVKALIKKAGTQLIEISKSFEPVIESLDRRGNRSHLMIEELGEHLLAVADNNEVEAFDGLVDLLYVLLGAARVYDLPMNEGFLEVHKSNMTKESQPLDVHKSRVREKGPNFKAPDLARVLENYRARQ